MAHGLTRPAGCDPDRPLSGWRAFVRRGGRSAGPGRVQEVLWEPDTTAFGPRRARAPVRLQAYVPTP